MATLSYAHSGIAGIAALKQSAPMPFAPNAVRSADCTTLHSCPGRAQVTRVANARCAHRRRIHGTRTATTSRAVVGNREPLARKAVWHNTASNSLAAPKENRKLPHQASREASDAWASRIVQSKTPTCRHATHVAAREREHAENLCPLRTHSISSEVHPSAFVTHGKMGKGGRRGIRPGKFEAQLPRPLSISSHGMVSGL